jgi:hypothetical protein
VSLTDFAAEGVEASRDVAARLADDLPEPLLKEISAGEQNLRTIVVRGRWRRRLMIWQEEA